ncbi:spermidine synthase [Actinoplanes sp. NEAU-A12]|uniref:Spermidine synthase n=1 Tax=Actinoplanes sandaracinus TaxID=3045177 RepID=A0ABT6WUK4_9ACTN|nr:spermidine synthase [Actinoplanes sandaracinus]MDI6103408.1 spermidine synthase [Actinoplanes sandaracinus]
MSARFEELAWHDTALGELSLRRRYEPVTGADVYEVKLGDEFLMSSLFTVAEEELSSRALALLDGDGLDVVVGGLGLGYTAATVLADTRVRSLIVVDALAELIEWHRGGLVPQARKLTGDDRCRLVHGDFFALTAGAAGYDPDEPGRRLDAILVDIDHSPRHLLRSENSPFYTVAGLRRLAGHLRPAGVFGLWSNDGPDDEFLKNLDEVFPTVRTDVVEFDNPLQRRISTNTVYLARPS